MINFIKWIFAAVPDSVKGHINATELAKLILGATLAFLGGSGVGGLAACLDYVQGNLNTAFPGIVNVGWSAAIITLGFDFVRRKYVHGTPDPKKSVKYTSIKSEQTHPQARP